MIILSKKDDVIIKKQFDLDRFRNQFCDQVRDQFSSRGLFTVFAEVSMRIMMRIMMRIGDQVRERVRNIKI